MTDQDFRVDQYSLINQLLNADTSEITKGVEILEKYDMIHYLQFDGLLQYLDSIHTSKDFNKIFEKEFQEYCQCANKDQTIKYKFPIVLKNCSSKLMYEKILMFKNKYQTQSEESNKSSSKKSEEPASNNKNQYQDQPTFLNLSLKQLKYQDFFVKKRSQQTQTPNQLNSCENHKKQKFKLEDYLLKNHENAIVPDFFYKTRDGKWRTSTKRLLSFTVYSAFKDEFDEVKSLISSQLNQEDGYLIETYQKLAANYIKLFFIRNGSCQPADLEDRKQKSFSEFIENYKQYLSQQNFEVNYCLPLHTSPLYQYWNKIIDGLEPLFFANRIETSDIAKFLLGPLKKSQLFYTPCLKYETIFGCGNKKTIFINVNHIANNNLSFERYKGKLLKPLIAVTLYHELAYKLIRKINTQKHLEDSTTSISISSDTHGCRILKLLEENSSKIKSFFQLAKINLNVSINQNQACVEQIQQNMKDIYEILRQSQSIKRSIEEKLPEFKKIKDTLNAINFVDEIVNAIQIDENFLSKSTQYFKKMEIETDQEFPKCKQTQYKFVFSLLYGAQHMNLRTLGNLMHLSQIPKKQKYFNGISNFIEKFTKKIKRHKKSFFESKEVQDFNEFILSRQTANKAFDDLFLEIEKFVANTCRFQLKKFQQRIYPYINYLSKSDLEQDYLNIYYQNKSLNKNDDIVAYMRRIFTFPQCYNRLMNILKYAEIYLIACQAPDFFMITAQKPYESGFNMKRRLFPNLNQYIFKKDYKILKNLSWQNAKQVGVCLQGSIQYKSRLFIARNISQYKQPCLYIGERQCGVHLLRNLQKQINNRLKSGNAKDNLKVLKKIKK